VSFPRREVAASVNDAWPKLWAYRCVVFRECSSDICGIGASVRANTGFFQVYKPKISSGDHSLINTE
jgi:hypothetical protein